MRPKKERLANSAWYTLYSVHVTRKPCFLLSSKLAAHDTLLANIGKASSCFRETGMTKRMERGGCDWVEPVPKTATKEWPSLIIFQ